MINPLLEPAKAFSISTIAKQLGVCNDTAYKIIKYPWKHKFIDIVILCDMLQVDMQLVWDYCKYKIEE